MISIRRYLREPGNPAAVAEPAPGSAVLSELCASILDHIGVYLLTGEYIGWRSRIDEPRNRLNAELQETEAAEIGQAVKSVLTDYNRAAQEAVQNTAIEMQQMVGVLSHALTVISGDSDRAVSRLRRIQETIQRTSSIQDVALLRASLRDIVQLIGEESSKERQFRTREREGLETQVVRFRELLAGNPNRRLPDRAEAIRGIRDLAMSAAPGKKVWVVAFALEQLGGMIQRYGVEAVDDLFFLLIRERLQPLGASCLSFRWGMSGIVGLLQLERELAEIQADMARLNRAPIIYRVALGNRTAVLKVGLSHMVREAPAPQGEAEFACAMEQLAAEIDRFTGYGEGA